MKSPCHDRLILHHKKVNYVTYCIQNHAALYTLGGDNVAYIDQMTISTENKTEKKDENGDTVKENGNTVYVYKDSFAEFGIRNNTEALKDVKSFKVLVGGTDVAKAGETTINLDSSTTTTCTATFKDGTADASDAKTETSGTKITLPDVPDATATRYYVGWTVDGSDGKTVLKPGTEYTLTANTQFNAKYYARGDLNQDGDVGSGDANLIYLYEAWDRDGIITDFNSKGRILFWDTNTGSPILTMGDVNQDNDIGSGDANYIYLYEAWDTSGMKSYLESKGKSIFWEDER